MSSFEVTSFIDQPIPVFNHPRKRHSEYPTFKALRRSRGELDFEDHLQLAFVWDDKDEFINAVKGLSPDQNLQAGLFTSMYSEDAINCISALINPVTSHHFCFDLMDTAMGKFKDRNPYYDDTCTTPFHQAAHYHSLNIATLLLHLGYSPNTRIDYMVRTSNVGIMEDALPLNVALKSLWVYYSMFEWSNTKSIFRLVAIVCGFMPEKVEMVRLLAQKTKDLDQEFFKYMKAGKLVEMCSLLLVGCRPPSSSLLQCRDDIPEKEKILELFETFNTIGDKLSSYIRIKRSKYITEDRVNSEIISLFEDSGLLVKSEDILLNYTLGPRVYPLRPTSDSKMISLPRLLSPPALGGSSFSNKCLSPIHGVRPFHSSSVPKVLQHQMKNKVIGELNVQLYKNCAYFTTALRRAGRLV